MTWSPKPEMQWRDSPDVEAARKLPGWVEFHKVCGAQRLFFDHIEKTGRAFICTAFTGSGTETRKTAEGSGKTVIEALEAAYRAARMPIDAADVALARMKGGADDFEALLGSAGDEDPMEMFG